MFQKYPENFAFQLFIICSNLPLKFAIFLKRSLFLTVSNVFYKTLRFNNSRTRTVINVKITLFVIRAEAIIYLLLYNLHDCTFN